MNGRPMDGPPVRGPNDVGGSPGGAVDTTDHGMTAWERQANALRRTLLDRGVIRSDELRRVLESLGHDRYHALGYFERNTEVLRDLLLEKGLVTGPEIDAHVEEVRARSVARSVPRSATSDGGAP